jgi:hypothetical protein
MISLTIWLHVIRKKFTDVSEERTAYILEAEEQTNPEHLIAASL